MRPGAHRAGLERHVERAAVEPPRAARLGRLGDGDHLGVGRRIVELLALVVRGGDHAVLEDDDRADRHFVLGQGRLGLVEGQLHEVVVHGCASGGWGAIRRRRVPRCRG